MAMNHDDNKGPRLDATFASIMVLIGAVLLVLAFGAVGYEAVNYQPDGLILGAAYGPMGLLAMSIGIIGLRSRRTPTLRLTLVFIGISAMSFVITTGTFFASSGTPSSNGVAIYNVILVTVGAIALPLIYRIGSDH